ncbi:hypothetical protein FHR33_003975 [Nonomuraea dietziae]|uniref:Uncharacterized protein n=1 Tax=Nonomuraea dietziae TaxID=65515 RepID=A0A7W5VAE7_9ACTN|nr:hypothetical protein [Nonomuraea dietziae]
MRKDRDWKINPMWIQVVIRTAIAIVNWWWRDQQGM